MSLSRPASRRDDAASPRFVIEGDDSTSGSLYRFVMSIRRIKEPTAKRLHCDHCGQDKEMRLRYLVDEQCWCSMCFEVAAAHGQVRR